MKVYIPNHLKNLTIIDQLSKLIQGYSEYYEETYNSFDDYYYSLRNDPVKKFISICIPSLDNKDQSYEDVVNYISRLFYSVKGTIKVFEYMKNYLGLVFEGDLVYTTKYIKFKLGELTLSDENLFYESLESFLNSLLYFQKLEILSDSINLVLKGEINNYVGVELDSFNKFNADIYEGDY